MIGRSSGENDVIGWPENSLFRDGDILRAVYRVIAWVWADGQMSDLERTKNKSQTRTSFL